MASQKRTSTWFWMFCVLILPCVVVVYYSGYRLLESKIEVNETLDDDIGFYPFEKRNSTFVDDEEDYLSQLLFNGSATLLKLFMNTPNKSLTDMIPLRIDYFRRSRVVVGDVSNLRHLLYQVIIKKHCITGIVLGGSVATGPHIGGKKYAWPKHLQTWLNLFFPCSSSAYPVHRIHNRAKGGTDSQITYHALANIFGRDNWNNYKCAHIDMILIDIATNDAGSPNTHIFVELIIRNILLCRDKVPVIIYLHSTKGQGDVMIEEYVPSPRIIAQRHGDLRQLPILQWYQIPTVSLSAVIYPLAYRYALNFHLNHTLMTYPALKKHVSSVNDEDDMIPFGLAKYLKEYDDIRYNFDEWKEYLRVDRVHPTVAGQKWCAMLIAYLWVEEWNKMQYDRVNLHKKWEDEWYQNKLWLSTRTLPPFLTFDPDKAPMFAYFATHHVTSLYDIDFDDIKAFGKRSTMKKFRDSLVENNGWEIVVENTAKQGFLCKDVGCSFTLKLDVNKETDRNVNGSTVVAIITYLVSYENMGVAQLWIDNYNHHNISSVHAVDALHRDEQISVDNVLHWQLNRNLNISNLYLHTMIIEPGEGHREVNKFKLINIKLCLLRF